MYKLKRSRPVKIICFLLASLFLFLLFVHLTGTVLLMHENAFQPAKAEESVDRLMEKGYTALARREAYRLADKGVIGYALEKDREGFLERFPGFSFGRTNFAFTVKDSDDNLLLSNFKPDFVFQTYNYDYITSELPEGWPIEGDVVYYDPTATDVSQQRALTEYSGGTEPSVSAAPATEMTTAAPTSAPEETATLPAAAPAQAPTENASATLPADEPTTAMPTTLAPGEEPSTTPPPANTENNPLKYDHEEVYIQDYGFDPIFLYVYPKAGGMNEQILSHCLDLYNGDYDTPEQQFYVYGQYAVYHQTDFAVSANGSVYYIGTRDNAPPTQTPELIEKHYLISVSVDRALKAQDSAYYLSLLRDPLVNVIRHAIGLGVFYLLAALFFGILSLVLTGYVKGEDAPAARGIHKLPMEFVLFIAVTAVALFCVILLDFIDVYYIDDIFLTLPVYPVVLYWCVYTFAARCKAHTLGSSFLLVKICKGAWKLIKSGARALSFQWQLGLGLGIVYLCFGIAGIVFIGFADGFRLFFGVLFVLFMIALLAAFLLLAINLQTLYSGAKDLAEGSNKPVENQYLFGAFKTHAQHLNSMADGVNAAVEERLKSESTKTELITNVSHDLKTPLTSIVNYIDLLKKEEIANPKAQEYIAVLDRQSQRLKKLTTDIVDASKAAAGSIQMTPENMDLKVLLGQMKGEYTEKLAAKGLTLVESLPETNPIVWADGKVLWRVFDNLMSNVVKYAMPGTRVYLTLTAGNGHAAVEFKNISEQPLNVSPAVLTDRFVRGDASRNSEGSGLGLNIAQSLVQNMGGNLHIGIDGDLFKAEVSVPLAKSE